MIFARNVVVKDLVIQGNTANSARMDSCGIVGGSITNSTHCEMQVIGGTAKFLGSEWENIGLFGKTRHTETGSQILLRDWYSEIQEVTGNISKVGGVTGHTDTTDGQYVLTDGWASINYPAGANSGSGIHPLIGDQLNYQATNIYVDNTKMPSPPGSGYFLKTTSEMYKETTFAGFSWQTVWYIEENGDYPRFMYASGITDNYIMVVYDSAKQPPPIDEASDSWRAGQLLRYKIYDVEDPTNPKDITSLATVSFLPFEGSELPPEEQIIHETTIQRFKAMDVGTLGVKIEANELRGNVELEIFGPSYFELDENFSLVFRKNVPRKGKIIAVYQDDFEEILTPLDDFVTSLDDTVVVEEETLKPTELGEHELQVKRFRTEEKFTITVEPPQLPDIVDVINTAATLYVFFRLGDKTGVDTYFTIRAFEDEAKTQEIVSRSTVDNEEDFTITIDGGGSWQPIPQKALSPSGQDSEMYCCRLFVGPKRQVFIDAGIALGTETEDVYAPLISVTPPPGTYNMPVLVTATLDEPGTIYYTIDEGIPSSLFPSDGVLVVRTSTLLLRAVDENGNVSKVAKFKYIIDAEAPIVAATPEPGTYLEPILVELYTPNETHATIYYTLDGSEPSIESEIFTTAIYFDSPGEYVIKAIAVDSAGNMSQVTEFRYIYQDGVKGDSFDNPIVFTEEDVVITALTPDILDVYFRYDHLIIGAEYIAEFIDVPAEQGGPSGLVVFDDQREYINSGWIMMPLTFTATSESMFFMAARGSNYWDPVKFKLKKA